MLPDFISLRLKCLYWNQLIAKKNFTRLEELTLQRATRNESFFAWRFSVAIHTRFIVLLSFVFACVDVISFPHFPSCLVLKRRLCCWKMETLWKQWCAWKRKEIYAKEKKTKRVMRKYWYKDERNEIRGKRKMRWKTQEEAAEDRIKNPAFFGYERPVKLWAARYE